MRVLIVEDEINNANLLKHELSRLEENFHVLAVLSSVEETVSYLKKENNGIDIIFMDVKLNDGYAFEIFEKIEITIPVIFITAYDDYILEAFKVNSISYIIKPVHSESLKNAISKLKAVSRHYNKSLNLNGFKKERLIVHKGSSKTSVLINDIAIFYSEMHLSFAVDFNGERFFLDSTLNQLETVIDPKVFFRISRQFLINIKAIKEFRSVKFSKMELTLIKNNWVKSPVIISQATAPDFKFWVESL